jgi:hypothetical protein
MSSNDPVSRLSMKARIIYKDGTRKIVEVGDALEFKAAVESDPDIVHTEFPVDDEPDDEVHKWN